MGVGWGPERLASIRSEAKPKPPVPSRLLSRAKSYTTAGESSYRVFRGGCWGYSPYYCRSAYRDSFAPSYRNNDVLGFRVARSQSVQ